MLPKLPMLELSMFPMLELTMFAMTEIASSMHHHTTHMARCETLATMATMATMASMCQVLSSHGCYSTKGSSS